MVEPLQVQTLTLDIHDVKIIISLAVVVAQLVERLLLIAEVCGLNPVIGKKLYLY